MKKIILLTSVLVLLLLFSACGEVESTVSDGHDHGDYTTGRGDDSPTIGYFCGFQGGTKTNISASDTDRSEDLIDVPFGDVFYGEVFEWMIPEQGNEWRTCKGVSPDGLWKYLFYVPHKRMYLPAQYVPSSDCYAFSSSMFSPGGSYGASVREYGMRFFPSEALDVVKSFLVPADGTVTVECEISRVHEWVQGGGGAPTAFSVYLGTQQVYPADGTSFLPVTSVEQQKISFPLEVKEGQTLYFRVGGINGVVKDSAVYMYNRVTYVSVDGVGEDIPDGKCAHKNLSEPTFSPAPTCLNSGYSCISCLDCSYVRRYRVAALGHDFSEALAYVVEKGSLHKMEKIMIPCSRCDEEKAGTGYYRAQDEKTGIALLLNTSVGLNTELSVAAVPSSHEVYLRLASAYCKDSAPLAAYDVRFVLGEISTKLNGTMKVSVPRGSFPDSLNVCYESLTGEVATVAAEVSSDTVTFSMPRCGGVFLLYQEGGSQ